MRIRALMALVVAMLILAREWPVSGAMFDVTGPSPSPSVDLGPVWSAISSNITGAAVSNQFIAYSGATGDVNMAGAWGIKGATFVEGLSWRGYQTAALSQYGYAIGTQASAGGDFAVAIGREVSAEETHSIAIGFRYYGGAGSDFINDVPYSVALSGGTSGRTSAGAYGLLLTDVGVYANLPFYLNYGAEQYHFPTTNGAAGSVIMSDGAGMLHWQTPIDPPGTWATNAGGAGEGYFAMSNRAWVSLVEADPKWSARSNDVERGAARGDEAYGWGNHATNGYLTNRVSEIVIDAYVGYHVDRTGTLPTPCDGGYVLAGYTSYPAYYPEDGPSPYYRQADGTTYLWYNPSQGVWMLTPADGAFTEYPNPYWAPTNNYNIMPTTPVTLGMYYASGDPMQMDTVMVSFVSATISVARAESGYTLQVGPNKLVTPGDVPSHERDPRFNEWLSGQTAPAELLIPVAPTKAYVLAPPTLAAETTNTYTMPAAPGVLATESGVSNAVAAVVERDPYWTNALANGFTVGSTISVVRAYQSDTNYTVVDNDQLITGAGVDHKLSLLLGSTFYGSSNSAAGYAPALGFSLTPVSPWTNTYTLTNGVESYVGARVWTGVVSMLPAGRYVHHVNGVYSMLPGAAGSVSYRSTMGKTDGATTTELFQCSSEPFSTVVSEPDSSGELLTNVYLSASERILVKRYALFTRTSGSGNATLSIFGGQGHGASPSTRNTRLLTPTLAGAVTVAEVDPKWTADSGAVWAAIGGIGPGGSDPRIVSTWSGSTNVLSIVSDDGVWTNRLLESWRY